MALFRRNKGNDEPAADPGDFGDVEATVSDDGTGAAEGVFSGAPRRLLEPSEVPDPDEYLKFGALWIKGIPGLQLQLESDPQTQQIVTLHALLGSTTIQLSAYAAPKTMGIWSEISSELAGRITQVGGTSEIAGGPFGSELHAKIPAEGIEAPQAVRFIGIDGPRWLLRAALQGAAAVNPAEAPEVEEFLAACVVDRGDSPMAPREVLPLVMPEAILEGDAAEAAAGSVGGADEKADEKADQKPQRDDFNPFERGPEITEIH